MKNEVYYSDDYAGLNTGDIEFYYGYEAEEKWEWCFLVKKNGTPIMLLPTSKIQSESDPFQLDSPRDFLLAGIGLYLAETKK